MDQLYACSKLFVCESFEKELITHRPESIQAALRV